MPDPRPRRRDADPPTDGRESLSRRRFLQVASAGAAAAVAGCAGDTTLSPAPSSLDSWPPATEADELVLRSVYDEWLSWAEDRFRSEHGVGFENYGDPIRWDHYRSEGDAFTPLVSPVQDAVDPIADAFGDATGDGAPTRKLDVVDVRPGWLEEGVEHDLVAPLPVEEMPAWENVPDRLKRGVHRIDGRTYGVPTEFTLSGLTYDTDVFETPPESWDVLWDDAYEEQILYVGDWYEIPMIAALYTGQDPADPDDVEDIREALEQQKPLLKATPRETDVYQSVNAFADGDAVVGSMDVKTTYATRFHRGATVDYVVPAEGATYKCYYHIVPKAAPNPMAALLYLNWSMRPRAAAKFFETEGRVPAPGVGDYLREEVRDFFALEDDWTLFDRAAPLDDDVSVAYSEILRDVYPAP
jgi:spermidine/putrescine transport system substrate-binding protein